MKSAFPHPDGYEGMSLREYFAAHAPTEIPAWFHYTKPPKDFPKHPSLDEISTDENDPHRREVDSWLQDPIYDLPEELQWFANKVKAHYDGKECWEQAAQRARYFQWRWAYADAMIEFGEAS